MGSRGGEWPRQRSREDGGGAAGLGRPPGQREDAPAHRTMQRGLPSLSYEGPPCGQPGAVEPAGCSREHRDHGAHTHVLSQGELMPRRPPPDSSCLRPALPQTHTPALGGRRPDPTEATSSSPPRCPTAPSHTDARGHCSRGEQVLSLGHWPGSLGFSGCLRPCCELLDHSPGPQTAHVGSHVASTQPRTSLVPRAGGEAPSAQPPAALGSLQPHLSLTLQHLALQPHLQAESPPWPGPCSSPYASLSAQPLASSSPLGLSLL